MLSEAWPSPRPDGAAHTQATVCACAGRGQGHSPPAPNSFRPGRTPGLRTVAFPPVQPLKGSRSLCAPQTREDQGSQALILIKPQRGSRGGGAAAQDGTGTPAAQRPLLLPPPQTRGRAWTGCPQNGSPNPSPGKRAFLPCSPHRPDLEIEESLPQLHFHPSPLPRPWPLPGALSPPPPRRRLPLRAARGQDRPGG